jgi:hypothetical protein
LRAGPAACLLRKNNKNLLLFCCWFVAYFFSRFAAVFCSLPRVEKPIRRGLLFGAAELRVDQCALEFLVPQMVFHLEQLNIAVDQRSGADSGSDVCRPGSSAAVPYFRVT